MAEKIPAGLVPLATAQEWAKLAPTEPSETPTSTPNQNNATASGKRPRRDPLEPALLREVIPTQEIDRQTAIWQRALAELPAFEDDARRTVAHELEKLHAQRIQADARDALQATRPDGCTCLGTGLRPHRDVVRDGGGKFCPCRDGQAALMEHLAKVQENDEQRRERERGDILGRSRLEHYPHFRELTLATFVPTPEQSYVHGRMCSYAAGAGSSVLLVGPPSRGKTGLAIAAARERATREGAGFVIWNAADLLTVLLRHVRDHETEMTDPVVHAERVRYLVLDDFDKIATTEFQSRVLYELVNKRYDRGLATLFTANLGRGELAAHLGAHITDRIFAMCGDEWVMTLEGPNRRLGQVAS